MTEGSATRDRFFDGRNAVRRAVAPQLLGGALSINDPEGRTVARWELGQMALVERDRASDSMVFAIASNPNPRLILFESAQRTALLAAEPKLRRLRRPPRPRGTLSRIGWTVFRVALVALFYFGLSHGID